MGVFAIGDSSLNRMRLANATATSWRALRQEFGNADEIVGRDCEGEGRFGFGASAQLDLGEPGLRLDPSEHLLDAFAADLTHLVARMAGGAGIDGGFAHDTML